MMGGVCVFGVFMCVCVCVYMFHVSACVSVHGVCMGQCFRRGLVASCVCGGGIMPM